MPYTVHLYVRVVGLFSTDRYCVKVRRSMLRASLRGIENVMLILLLLTICCESRSHEWRVCSMLVVMVHVISCCVCVCVWRGDWGGHGLF